MTCGAFTCEESQQFGEQWFSELPWTGLEVHCVLILARPELSQSIFVSSSFVFWAFGLTFGEQPDLRRSFFFVARLYFAL
jgi:hypothetical protein